MSNEKSKSIKTAIVTGGGSGIGRCTVERMLKEGWAVWSLDLADQSPLPGRFTSLRCDVTDPNSVKAALAAVGKEIKHLDALICSAGVLRIGSLEDHTPEQVDLMLGVHVKGPWNMVRESLPLLREGSTVADPARVVFVGSIASIRPKVGTGLYAAAKSAQSVMAGIFAVELGPSGITVNTVAPGSVDTPMLRNATAAASSDPKSSYKASGVSPLGRIAMPDDVADVIMFFLSDAAKYVSGTVLPVDGGTRAAFLKN